MKKNVIVIALIFLVPLVAFWVLNNSNTSDAKSNVDVTNQPQVMKFTSTMCLDCQKMNKIFKEVFPKYEGKIVLTEIMVQDGKAFTNEQVKKYNVTLVPTMIFLDSNGKQIKRIEGAIEKEELDNYLKGLK